MSHDLKVRLSREIMVTSDRRVAQLLREALHHIEMQTARVEAMTCAYEVARGIRHEAP